MPNEVPNSTIVRARCASRQHVEQRAGFSRDGERKILHPPIELAIVGLAAHQAGLLVVGEIGECGVDVRLGGLGVRKQTVEEGGEGGGGERCHENIQSGVEGVFRSR